MNGVDQFDLTVQVPADEWAYSQRRLRFFEAMAFRLLRDSGQLQEWFTAGELASLRLPGLSHSVGAVTRKANLQGWLRQAHATESGPRYLYHVTSLPARSFDELVRRLLDLPDADLDNGHWVDGIRPEPPTPLAPENTAPPWVLPLMRLMKGDANGNLSRAWRQLPEHLPKGTVLPSVEEAAEVLVRFGLADKG